jgi:exodeoxyribonuclease V alpha subunit
VYPDLLDHVPAQDCEMLFIDRFHESPHLSRCPCRNAVLDPSRQPRKAAGVSPGATCTSARQWWCPQSRNKHRDVSEQITRHHDFGTDFQRFRLLFLPALAADSRWVAHRVDDTVTAMNQRGEASTQEVLAGVVERVTFHNAENGFCVLRIKARGHRDLVTIVGHSATISAGEWITASGEWVNDRTHGQQFKARFLKTSAPSSIEGIEKYLSSGMIRGIGLVYAKKMVKAFGEKVLDIIDAAPHRLREVDGIGPVRARRITETWAEQKVVREIMVFLHSHGVSTARAVRIYKTYGADAVQVMTENPFRLARDIRGIGFRTADAIAMRLGIEKTAMIRVRAGISYALTEAMDEGHCGLPTEELVPLTVELLEVPKEAVLTALDLELADGTVIADTVGATACAFLGGLYRAEQVIAERLRCLVNGTLPWPCIDPEKALPWIEQKIGLALAESQVAAVRLALLSKALVITGGPGVGKTTIVNAILRILAAKGVNLLLCAPTGRAAKRMTEASGFEAKTIHRLLEVDPRSGGFKRSSDIPLVCDLLVVDETSMVDVLLMQALLRAVPDHAALLIVGDIDQLPSVGPGQVLADIIASGAVPVVRLTEVFRQAAESRIITSAHRINHGTIPDLGKPEGASDFYFVRADDPESAVPRIIELVKTRIPQRFGLDPIRDIQVLCPMNRGAVGARSLNIDLQAALNPAGERKVERFGWTFAPGDKVMQIENDYDKQVYNGDIGYVDDVDPDVSELTASFDGRAVSYGFGELDTLVPAYAATIHKSQGSEYPAVVIPVMTQHYAMLQRNLLYTGLTRGKRLVVLVGQKKAIAIAVHNVSGRRRWSKLKEWLGDCLMGVI